MRPQEDPGVVWGQCSGGFQNNQDASCFMWSTF